MKATFSGRHLAVLFLTLFTPAGAGVESADGSWQPIESIQEGDLVWAHDPETGEKGVREVVTFFDAHLEESMVTITLGDDTLTATQHHPFWSVTRSAWIDAGDLFVGEYLLQADGGVDVVDAVHRYQFVTTVYNFEVEGLHTYFVEADGEGVLVHNCSGTIKESQKAWNHVGKRHTPGGKDSLDKSFFNDGQDLHGLLRKADTVAWQAGKHTGTRVRILDSPNTVGWDEGTQGWTSTYTVVTNDADELITMHPGRPW